MGINGLTSLQRVHVHDFLLLLTIALPTGVSGRQLQADVLREAGGQD